MYNPFLIIWDIQYISNLFRCFLFLYFYDFHCTSYTPKRVSVFSMWFEYPELPLLFLYVLFISNIKCSACLPYVYQWQTHTFHSVHDIFVVWFCHVLNCVSCSKCCFYLSFFRQFCNFLSFLSTICENGPFSFLVLSTYFCCVCVDLDVLCLSFYYIHCFSISPFVIGYACTLFIR
jgi:hypothetical protein